jgi:addiction module HigA family antidote
MRKLRIRQGFREDPVHPGEWLFRAFLYEYDVSQNMLARAMGVSPRRVNEIVNGRRAITGETALLLEDATGIRATQWMALQAEYELALARRERERRPPRKKVPLPGMEQPIEGIGPPEGWYR